MVSRMRRATAIARLPPALSPAMASGASSVRVTAAQSSSPAGNGCSGAGRVAAAHEPRAARVGERAARGVERVDRPDHPAAAVEVGDRAALRLQRRVDADGDAGQLDILDRADLLAAAGEDVGLLLVAGP